jgi:hypothetical protein
MTVASLLRAGRNTQSNIYIQNFMYLKVTRELLNKVVNVSSGRGTRITRTRIQARVRTTRRPRRSRPAARTRGTLPLS